jgi:hypothetical protein
MDESEVPMSEFKTPNSYGSEYASGQDVVSH